MMMSDFSPETASMMERACDAAILEVVGPSLTAPTSMRETIKKAVVAITAAGQRDPEKICRYATFQGRAALVGSDARELVRYLPCIS